jgi:hypothetical protein
MARAGRPSSLLAALAAAAACATALAAPAAADWETPATTLSPYRLGTWDSSVSLDRNGNALALWTSSDEAETPGRQNVYATDNPLGGAWAPLTEVWPGAYAVAPTLAGNAAGDAVAAWVGNPDDYGNDVHVAERSGATGAWGGHHSFAAADVVQEGPAVAINDRGDAIATWVESAEDGIPYLRASTRTGSGWSAPVTVSDPGDVRVQGANYSPPRLALAADGTAHVLWRAYREDDDSSYVQQSHFDGAAWSAPQDLATAAAIYSLELSDDGQGGLAAAWLTGFDPMTVQAAWLSGGAWTVADVPADPLPSCATPLAVSASPGGRATIAWESAATGGGLSTISGVPGAWDQPRTLYTPPEGTEVGTVTLREGFGKAPVVAWTTVNYDDWVFSVFASQSTASGWQAPTLLSTTGGRDYSRPSVAMDPTGRAIASWVAYQAYSGKVQVAWASGLPSPTPAPTPGVPVPPATPGAGGLGVLNPPFVRVRGGMLRLPRRGRMLSTRLVNRETVPLRGTARLVHFFGRPTKDGSPMRTIAFQSKVRVVVKGKSKLRLKLSAAAIERLRKSRRHAYPARLYLRLRAPDGRTVKTTQTFTLDGWNRFGNGKQRQPVARKSC